MVMDHDNFCMVMDHDACDKTVTTKVAGDDITALLCERRCSAKVAGSSTGEAGSARLGTGCTFNRAHDFINAILSAATIRSSAARESFFRHSNSA